MTQTALLRHLCRIFGYKNRSAIYDMCLVAENHGLVTPVGVTTVEGRRYQWSRRLATLKCTGKI